MRGHVLGAFCLLAGIVALPGQAGAASAPTNAAPPTSSPEHRQAVNGTRLLFTFNHDSLSGGSRVTDTAGRPDDGRVLTGQGGTIRPVSHGQGKAAQFPAPCVDPGCPRAIINVRDKPRLNPGDQRFSFGAEVRLSAKQAVWRSTIIQKGKYFSQRGRWRLRVDGDSGRPYCLVKGTKGLLRIRAENGIANGAWHQLTCTRKGPTLRLFVDGSLRASKTGPIGRVANGAPIRVGGFATFRNNNQFFGGLDDVFLRVR
jgi:hypothetical protein